MSLRCEVEFLKIGANSDNVLFYAKCIAKIVRTIKSITAKEIFRQLPKVKKQWWGGEFWSDGY